VSSPLPTVTIIIPAKPGLQDILAVQAVRQMDYPSGQMEILVARGKHPSVQRNTALREARGEIIYFLDDDSCPPPGNLLRAAAHFADASVKMAGGPNLCPADAPALEQVFALVLASWLAFGPSRARYWRVGQTRTSGEKELILCNLLARRADLLELGGFNEALYPNEENALMDELQKRGGKLIYDPDLLVHRRPRRTLKSFARMLMTYGRGRAEQFRVNPTPGSALNFVPPLFCVYLLATFFLFRLVGNVAFVPLALYTLAVVLQTLALIPMGGVFRSLVALPLIVLTHIFYGLGFWRGLFTKLKVGGGPRTDVPVTLEKISP
jgi:cellulose synthase/poly-beta-1,6-N-acetylglucosamine synthase-like glycosyltransferase